MKYLSVLLILMVFACSEPKTEFQNQNDTIFNDELFIQFAELNVNIYDITLGEKMKEHKDYKYCFMDIIMSTDCDHIVSERCTKVKNDTSFINSLENTCKSRKLGIEIVKKYNLKYGGELYELMVEYNSRLNKKLK